MRRALLHFVETEDLRESQRMTHLHLEDFVEILRRAGVWTWRVGPPAVLPPNGPYRDVYHEEYLGRFGRRLRLREPGPTVGAIPGSLRHSNSAVGAVHGYTLVLLSS